MYINIAEKRPDQEKGPRNDICIFKGKEYLKGQSIPTGEPCRLCTCDDGFTGMILIVIS